MKINDIYLNDIYLLVKRIMDRVKSSKILPVLAANFAFHRQ